MEDLLLRRDARLAVVDGGADARLERDVPPRASRLVVSAALLPDATTGSCLVQFAADDDSGRVLVSLHPSSSSSDEATLFICTPTTTSSGGNSFTARPLPAAVPALCVIPGFYRTAIVASSRRRGAASFFVTHVQASGGDGDGSAVQAFCFNCDDGTWTPTDIAVPADHRGFDPHVVVPAGHGRLGYVDLRLGCVLLFRAEDADPEASSVFIALPRPPLPPAPAAPAVADLASSTCVLGGCRGRGGLRCVAIIHHPPTEDELGIERGGDVIASWRLAAVAGEYRWLAGFELPADACLAHRDVTQHLVSVGFGPGRADDDDEAAETVCFFGRTAHDAFAFAFAVEVSRAGDLHLLRRARCSSPPVRIDGAACSWLDVLHYRARPAAAGRGASSSSSRSRASNMIARTWRIVRFVVDLLDRLPDVPQPVLNLLPPAVAVGFDTAKQLREALRVGQNTLDALMEAVRPDPEEKLCVVVGTREEAVKVIRSWEAHARPPHVLVVAAPGVSSDEADRIRQAFEALGATELLVDAHDDWVMVASAPDLSHPRSH